MKYSWVWRITGIMLQTAISWYFITACTVVLNVNKLNGWNFSFHFMWLSMGCKSYIFRNLNREKPNLIAIKEKQLCFWKPPSLFPLSLNTASVILYKRSKTFNAEMSIPYSFRKSAVQTMLCRREVSFPSSLSFVNLLVILSAICDFAKFFLD